MKNAVLFFLIIVVIGGCRQAEDPLSVLRDGQWIDLTWAFDEESIYWPTNIPFSHDTVFAGITEGGYYYSSFHFAAEEHGGTHFDAPIHFAENGKTVDQIGIDQLNGPGILVDVKSQAASDRDYQITVGDLQAWEEEHGRIPHGAIVLFNTGFWKFYPDKLAYTGTDLTGQEGVNNLSFTGFWKFYPDKLAYTGTDLTGQEGVNNLSFPGIHPHAATWLVENRDIKAVGLDTSGIDYGKSKGFMTHRILFAQGVTAYENLAYLDELPPEGFWIMALPRTIRGGSGAPLRVVAFLP